MLSTIEPRLTNLSASEVLLTTDSVRLILNSQRAAFDEATRTLFVADTHFGKAARFRQAGVPVPQGTTTKMLQRISELLKRFKVLPTPL